MSVAFALEGQINLNAQEVLQGLKSVDKKVEDTDRNINSGARGVNSSLTAIKVAGVQAITDLGSKMASGLSNIISNATEGTRELREDMSKLRTVADNTGNTWDDVNEQFKEFNAVSGETDSSVEALNNLMNTGLSGSQLAKAVDDLSGAVVAFPDTMKIESLADSLQETVATGSATGQFSELLGRCGINVDSFNEKLGNCKDQNERLNFAMQTLSDTGLSKVGDQWKEQNKDLIDSSNAQISYQEALANLGQTLTPLITQITNFATKLIEWFNSLSPNQQLLVGIITGLIAILPTLISIISGLCTIGTALAEVELATLWPIALIVAAIVALIAIGVLLYKNWDTIKEKATQLKDWIVEKFTAIKDWIVNAFNTVIDFFKNNWQGILLFILNPFAGAFKLAYDNCEGFRNKINSLVEKIKGIFSTVYNAITHPFETAKNVVVGIVEHIKGLFNFNWSLPHIKLPHFSLKGSFNDMLRGKGIPRIAVEWYANGGIMTQPTMFGFNPSTGNPMVGGEAGNEAIIPLEKLYSIIETIGNRPIQVNVNGKNLITACGSDISELLGSLSKKVR